MVNDKDKIKKIKVDKSIKADYHQINKNISSAKIKSHISDAKDNKIYIFDEYDSSGRLLSFNRYCIVGSPKQPFEELTSDEELILNPPVEELEEELI